MGLLTVPICVLRTRRLTKINKIVNSYYSSVVEKELEVPVFCDIDIRVPHSIKLKPLNVHKYHNCNKLIIQIDRNYEDAIEHSVDGNKITITSHAEAINSDILCSIKAPVKANLNIKAQKDITLGFFNGDKIKLCSVDGNIFVDRFQGNSIDVSTKNGDIDLCNFIQAAKISASVIGKGSLRTGRLQGLNLKLKTSYGNISVESSYCSDSIFIVDKGNIELHNVHKSCELLLNKGLLNLTGFDGKLKAIIRNGSANIHLSRITEDSEITLEEGGTLNLKLTEACQDYTKFIIQAPNGDISDNIKSLIKRENGAVILSPEIEEVNKLFVNCFKNPLTVESTSWQDMIKMKIKSRPSSC